MLYGSVAMGACYLIAALTLKGAKDDPSKKKIVRLPFYSSYHARLQKNTSGIVGQTY